MVLKLKHDEKEMQASCFIGNNWVVFLRARKVTYHCNVSSTNLFLSTCVL